MIKIVGKIACLLLCIGISSYLYSSSGSSPEATIVMSLTTEEGDPLKSVEVNTPFILVVSVERPPQDTYKLHVEVGATVHVLNKSHQVYSLMLNGNTKISHVYQYRVQVSEPGTVTLGPVFIDNVACQGCKPLQITAHASQKKGPLESLIHIDKNEFFVGERIPVHFSIKSASSIACTSIQMPEVEHVYLEFEKQPHVTTEQSGSTPYTTRTWSGSLSASEAGTYTFSGPRITYERPSAQAQNPWISLFNVKQVTQHLFIGQPVSFTVCPLPPTQGPQAELVGVVTSFTSTFDKTEVAQGEGILLSLTFKGKGNFRDFTYSGLSLPGALKVYPSKTELRKTSYGYEKRFEYVLQALEPGTYLFPKQKCTYFDPDTKAYKTAITSLETLTVTANKTEGACQEQNQLPDITEPPSEEKSDEVLAQQVAYYKHTKIEKRYLPWSLFLTSLLLPLCFASATYWYEYTVGPTYQKIREYKRAFSKAYKKIKKAEKEKDIGQLYTIFKQLLLVRLRLGYESTDDAIIRALHNFLPLDLLKSWSDFNRFLLESSTYNVKKHERSCIGAKEDLFKQALVWFNIFKKKI